MGDPSQFLPSKCSQPRSAFVTLERNSLLDRTEPGNFSGDMNSYWGTSFVFFSNLSDAAFSYSKLPHVAHPQRESVVYTLSRVAGSMFDMVLRAAAEDFPRLCSCF